MIGLMLHGAMGRLVKLAGVEGFEFQHIVVQPTLAPGRKEVVVAFDGEDLGSSGWRSGHGRRARGGGMSVLLQISDTHFGTEQPPVEALVALAAQQRPDVVVLSGDITQRARPAHSARPRPSSIDCAPVLAIPGNDDIALFDVWARLTRPYALRHGVWGRARARVAGLRGCQHHTGMASQER